MCATGLEPFAPGCYISKASSRTASPLATHHPTRRQRPYKPRDRRATRRLDQHRSEPPRPHLRETWRPHLHRSSRRGNTLTSTRRQWCLSCDIRCLVRVTESRVEDLVPSRRGGQPQTRWSIWEVGMSTVQTAIDIRPFHVDIAEEQLSELRDRIAGTRWPTRELVTDRSQGVQLATIKALAD